MKYTVSLWENKSGAVLHSKSHSFYERDNCLDRPDNWIDGDNEIQDLSDSAYWQWSIIT